MRLLLIVNTSASSVTPRARVVIHKTLSSAHDVTLKETNRRGHAARLAQGAVADGADVVVVLGGDGTLNEAANGLAGSNVALAVLPGGSTNVFARTIGVANEALEATDQLLGALASGCIVKVGLGQANGRYFLFHAGIGFDAAVVAKVETLAPLKRYTGPLVFMVAALSTWARGYDRRRPHFRLEAEGTRLPDCYFSVCLNTDPYTFLGTRPLHLAPATSLADQLSLVTFQRLNLASVLPTMWAAVGTGAKVGATRGVSVVRDLAEVRVTSEEGVPYQLDGDFVGTSTRVDLRWEADAISLVMPPSTRV